MRIANRLLALVVSVALIAVGIILVVEVIAARSHADPLIVHWTAIRRWGERNTWQATSVEVASVCTLVGGLILLVPQLVRRRATRFALDTDGPVTATLTRRSLAVAVRSAVNTVEGVTAAQVKVRRRAIRVTAESASLDPDVSRALVGTVEDAANSQLAALRLSAPPRVRASVGYRRTGRV